MSGQQTEGGGGEARIELVPLVDPVEGTFERYCRDGQDGTYLGTAASREELRARHGVDLNDNEELRLRR